MTPMFLHCDTTQPFGIETGWERFEVLSHFADHGWTIVLKVFQEIWQGRFPPTLPIARTAARRRLGRGDFREPRIAIESRFDARLDPGSRMALAKS